MNKRETDKSMKQPSAEMKERLQRMQAQRGRAGSANSPAKIKISGKAEKLHRALGGEIVSSQAGEYLCLKHFYGSDYIHGRVAFRGLAKTAYKLSHFSGSGADAKLTAKEFLFFDTETTGLSGAGAVPFLIGFGMFVSGGFETRQYIIPDFADEQAMLEDIFAEFSPERTLVSYNGKSFDKPLIEDRLIIHRIARSVPFRHHLDLLHTSRSLFKRRLGDCSLGNIEQHALGYARDDDIPGYLVPAVYLDWIHNDEVGQLSEVIAHNRQDIVSLAALVSVISESFESAGATLSSSLDAYSLMQVCEKRRKGQLRELALRIGRERERDFVELGNPEIEFRRSMIFKRAGKFDSAVEIWRRLATGDNRRSDMRRPSQQARLELAKWYEHRCKDYRQALQLTESGLRFELKQSQSLDDWNKRRQRLRRRIGANSLSANSLSQ
jgi:uncharacterized protein